MSQGSFHISLYLFLCSLCAVHSDCGEQGLERGIVFSECVFSDLYFLIHIAFVHAGNMPFIPFIV